jgi:hypothetical protein
MSGFFVCGFGDPAAGIGGLAWDLGEPGAAILLEGAVLPATFAAEQGGSALTLELTAQETTVDATLSPRTAEIALGGEAGLTSSVCEADVGRHGSSGSIQCAGQITRWGSDPLAGAGSFRHLAIDAGEQSLVVVEARGEPGAEHGDERMTSSLIRGEDQAPFEDSFVSTEYGGDGQPTRFGLELWPAEAERASRAAAVRVAASPVGGVRIGEVWGGLFRCQTDGVLGMGSYLLWRG